MTDLKALGNKSEIPNEPSTTILETFPIPTKEMFYVTFIQKGEFSSLCPITRQPDFGDIKILYRPNEKCLESKSLKLYLASYRNQGSFGEAITNRIADDLFEKLDPLFLLVVGDFKPRGGIGWSTEAVRYHFDYTLDEMTKLQIQRFNIRTVSE